MSTAHIILTLVGAALAAFSAGSVFLRAPWVVQPLAEYGVPRSWWPFPLVYAAPVAASLLVL